MNESDSIAKLEAILNEFYHQSTSNFRKKEIERDLKTFQDNDSSWNFLIHNLTSSGFNNQYLWFFSVSTLEVTKVEIDQASSTNDSAFAAYNNKKMEQIGREIKDADSRFSLADLLQLSIKHRSNAER